ncbi:hypothetical protein RIF29_38220 [Crotalaria pallida]|uniref:Uncharacterized protein n=1 Tax=Crotalaria pallida TaxID=3830 RepID=A0AAN9DYS9_CROPI
MVNQTSSTIFKGLCADKNYFVNLNSLFIFNGHALVDLLQFQSTMCDEDTKQMVAIEGTEHIAHYVEGEGGNRKFEIM